MLAIGRILDGATEVLPYLAKFLVAAGPRGERAVAARFLVRDEFLDVVAGPAASSAVSKRPIIADFTRVHIVPHPELVIAVGLRARARVEEGQLLVGGVDVNRMMAEGLLLRMSRYRRRYQ